MLGRVARAAKRAPSWSSWPVPKPITLEDTVMARLKLCCRAAGGRPTRSSWAELLKRVFEIDALTCLHCAGNRKLIALLTDGQVVLEILAHLGLSAAQPSLAPACSPPEPMLAW